MWIRKAKRDDEPAVGATVVCDDGGSTGELSVAKERERGKSRGEILGAEEQ